MQVYLVHTSYAQPYCYDGENYDSHSIKLFSTMALAQNYAQTRGSELKGGSGVSVEIQVITLDDLNSGIDWSERTD